MPSSEGIFCVSLLCEECISYPIYSQGEDASKDRKISETVPIQEVPFIMQAMGFYASAQEIEDMVNEVKYSRFAEANGEVVITMDADLQDSPDEIPGLIEMIKTEGYDVVSGWKKKRYDPLSKTIPTKLFNWATRKISDLELHDFNCGLKAYRNEVVKNIEVYGEMHRYIPVIAKWAGFPKVGEKVVVHQARKYGSTKFGMNRFVNGFLDLMSLFFMSKFGKKPMHFFGLLGVLNFLVGLAMACWILIDKLIYVIQDKRAPLVTDSPIFYIGLVAMIIGTQLFLAGFIGELVSRSNPERNLYNIKETTD